MDEFKNGDKAPSERLENESFGEYMTALCTSLTTHVECITLENEAQRAKCEKEKQTRTSTYEKTLSQMMEDDKQLNEIDSDRSQEEDPMPKHLTEEFE